MKLPKTFCIFVTEVTWGIHHIKADQSQAKPWAYRLLDRSSQKPGSTFQAARLKDENLSLTGWTWGTQDWDLSKPKISQHLELVNNYTVAHIPGDCMKSVPLGWISWISCLWGVWFRYRLFCALPLGAYLEAHGKMVSTGEFRVDWAVWSQPTRKRIQRKKSELVKVWFFRMSKANVCTWQRCT